MAKEKNQLPLERLSAYKRTNQGGVNPKTSSMNKSQRKNYKVYRGQGK